MDPAITFDSDGIVEGNSEQILINTAGSWDNQPNAVTSIPNFFLAAVYVRCNVDLATMEAANEAGRLATNGVLHMSDSEAEACEMWALKEFRFLNWPKFVDGIRYSFGMPHRMDRIIDKYKKHFI
ncbi:MAG: hypothetical protein KUG82_16715 [Pseudomonadales bacterium]|nr:hypothetical protein [Pseudomonadales bacterium]